MRSDETKSYIYDEAANGLTVRIPADRYEQWKKRQDEIRAGIDSEGTKDHIEEMAKQLKKSMQAPAPVAATKKPRLSVVLCFVLSALCIALAALSVYLYLTLSQRQNELAEAEKVINYAEDLFEYAESDREAAITALDNDTRIHTEGLDPDSDEYLSELVSNIPIYRGVKSNYLALFQDYCSKHWPSVQ